MYVCLFYKAVRGREKKEKKKKVFLQTKVQHKVCRYTTFYHRFYFLRLNPIIICYLLLYLSFSFFFSSSISHFELTRLDTGFIALKKKRKKCPSVEIQTIPPIDASTVPVKSRCRPLPLFPFTRICMSAYSMRQ